MEKHGIQAYQLIKRQISVNNLADEASLSNFVVEETDQEIFKSEKQQNPVLKVVLQGFDGLRDCSEQKYRRAKNNYAGELENYWLWPKKAAKFSLEIKQDMKKSDPEEHYQESDKMPVKFVADNSVCHLNVVIRLFREARCVFPTSLEEPESQNKLPAPVPVRRRYR